MNNFKGRVRTEGKKGYLAMGIPGACGIVAPGWFRLTIAGYPPCFLYARKEVGRYSRTSLPVWNFAGLQVGDEVDARAEPAEPYRAKGSCAGRFDWNDFVGGDERTFATEEPNGVLKLWSRYSAPLELLRCPPEGPLYRMLGFYQAEGSKSATGADFSFANSNVEAIRNAVENLNAIGLETAQLYAEVLQGVGESRESALAKYASLSLRVAAVRPRSGRGGSAYVVHLHNSSPFRGMVNRVLEHVFANEFPSKVSALAYALGWLDGDGNITRTSGHVEMRLAGLADEHIVLCTALNKAFGWTLKNENYLGNKNGTHIVLRAAEMLDLIEAQAFWFSMNYVRLLLGFDAQTEGIRGPVTAGPFVRWGLRNKGGSLTEIGERLCAGYLRHQSEIERARRLETTSPELFGVKGAPNPLLR
jgi:hypothetical protein